MTNNTMDGNANGVLIHNAFNVTVTGNSFTHRRQSHIQMHESSPAPSVRNNLVTGNTVVSRRSEETYRGSSAYGVGSVVQFAAYDGNTYSSSSTIFANFNGATLSFWQWRERIGQDASSTYKAP